MAATDLTRMAVLVLTVAAVLVLELLNTAMEAVDLAIGRRFHPLAQSPRTVPRLPCWWLPSALF